MRASATLAPRDQSVGTFAIAHLPQVARPQDPEIGLGHLLDAAAVSLSLATCDKKGEVDRDTYRLFDLQTGVPTDAYNLDETVASHAPRRNRTTDHPQHPERRGCAHADNNAPPVWGRRTRRRRGRLLRAGDGKREPRRAGMTASRGPPPAHRPHAPAPTRCLED